MNRYFDRANAVGWITAFVTIAGATAGRAETSQEVLDQFAQPSREYSSGPLWVWNDMLTEEQIVSTMEDLAAQQVKQVFVHPRPGLMTPYLSDDWFRLWRRALQAAERLDMNVWIYDENSYPSGFAGGLVPAAMPESRGRGLVIREVKRPPESQEGIVAVFRRTGEDYVNVTPQVRAGENQGEGQYLVASIRLAPTGGWFGGKYYVDLLRPGVTEKFLEITMDAYRRHIGDQFGKRVPGVFTDEPHLAPAGGLHWSEHLPQLFQDRWGYDLVDHLPCLVQPVGDWRRVRHNYYELLLEQFIARWGKPFYEYCEAHNLEFTGHYWEHGWPGAGHGGDNMAMYAWHQRPAIDILMNQYREDAHAQFGNVRALLELASVANQLDRRRTLCEAYGAGGWDLRLEDMKRIGDWLYVLGVNTMNEHLSYITIRGARKRDHPQSFSYHTPWWEAYHVMAEYFTRLSLVLSSGQQVNRILVIEPTTTTWMYQSDPHLDQIGESFQSLVTRLAKDQIELDIGCEDIMGRHGSVKDSQLVVGQRRYDTVVLPPLAENLNEKTMALMETYLEAGGTVLCCGGPPTRVDGRLSPRGKRLAEQEGFQQIETATASQRLLERADDGFAIQRPADDQGILYHHRRQLEDGEFLFLVNTSIDAPCAGQVQSQALGIQQWDLHNGTSAPYAFQRTRDGVSAGFSLPPSGSVLLFLSREPCAAAVPTQTARTPVPAAGSLTIQRVDPNVLTLDYVDITAGGETKKRQYFYQAWQFAFRQNGMDGNPWERAVQFRDELISKTFPADSGFEATYRFMVKDQVPDSLEIVIERPDLYTITCNGKPVVARENAWWLDRSFGRISLASTARVGENAVTLKASPMTVYHELEPAYVLGQFALNATAAGFVIVGDRSLEIKPRVLLGDTSEGTTPHRAGGGWNRQGCPFYGAGVSYQQSFELAEPQGKYVVSLPDWQGSVAKVSVNGKFSNYIAYPPWQCDVTGQIQPGRNVIEVVVIGTLKNTLGPHHAEMLRGAAWPHMFQQGPPEGPPPGVDYDTIDYGLFEPFSLISIK